jgi:FkbM family methyltransferase
MTLQQRLKTLFAYAGIARSPLGVPALALAGYARGCQLESDRWIDRFSRRHWRVIALRPRGFGGARIWVDLTDLGHLVSFDEIAIGHCYDLTKVPFVPGRIVDCGAHIGMFTILAARRFRGAAVATFEPNPANAAFVRRQVESNGLKVEFFEAAVSTRDGEAEFCDPDHASNGGRLGEGGGGYRVKVIDLIAYIRSLPASPLLLKMDIEGEELNLLPALIPLLPDSCAIFFETHGGESAWNLIRDKLRDARFSVEAISQAWPYCNGFALRTASGYTNSG